MATLELIIHLLVHFLNLVKSEEYFGKQWLVFDKLENYVIIIQKVQPTLADKYLPTLFLQFCLWIILKPKR